MAKFVGKNGRVTFDDVQVLNVKSWKTDFKSNTVGVPAMGEDWETYLAGLNTWDITVEAYLDDTTNIEHDDYLGEGDSGDADLSKYEILLEFDTGEDPIVGISGYAYLVSKAIKEPVDNVVTVTYKFKGIPSSAGVGPVEGELA